jgi:hypothetical protein
VKLALAPAGFDHFRLWFHVLFQTSSSTHHQTTGTTFFASASAPAQRGHIAMMTRRGCRDHPFCVKKQYGANGAYFSTRWFSAMFFLDAEAMGCGGIDNEC